MTPTAELYRRGTDTLLASWEHYARAARSASLQHLPGVSAAVFPNEPERLVYNNALVHLNLTAEKRERAMSAMEAAYASAGVTDFAAWVHESDAALRTDIERRGYVLGESTRAMGMALADVSAPRPQVDLATLAWPEYLRTFGFPEGLLTGGDVGAFHVLVARLDGESVATAMAFDHAGDCGIYNVETLAPARRRGVGSALTAVHLHDARTRGCRTASVQASEMAEGMYRAAGFRDLGRILEYVPG
jgi:ribosomal protein S18 acetylase RimI-like enzyme